MSGFSGAPVTGAPLGAALLVAPALLLPPLAAVLDEELELHALTPTASAATARISGRLKRRWTFIVLLLSFNNFLNRGVTRGPAHAGRATA
jgi:hypothetical protein